MTFTKETPTKPGYYLWREGLDGEVPEVCAIRKDEDGDLVAGFESGFELILPTNGEWCRLVPAEEIEKAWYEGYDYTLYVPDQSRGADLRRWLTSRANRVMEGDL